MGSRLFGRQIALLRRASSFRALFLATLGSGLGTMLAVIALTVDVYERTESGVWVSALLIADFLPTIAIGLLFGPLIDRISRRGLMIASDLARCAVFVLLPFANSPELIVAGALVVGFANGFFGPAARAGLPNLVDDADLPHANSLLEATSNLTWMVGPLLGGVLLGLSGPDLPYWINAVTFLVSALLIVRIPRGALSIEQPISRGHWRDLAEGFSLVVRSRALLTVAVAWTLAMLANASINVSEVFFVREALDGGNASLGVMMGGAGLGLVLGAVVAAAFLDRGRMGVVYGLALALMGIGFLAASRAPSVAVALIFVVAAGFGNGIASVCNPLLVQRGAPDRLRGRAFTVVMSINFVFLGLGMAIAGPATDAYGPRALWGFAGGVCLIAAVVGAVLARGVRGPVGAEQVESYVVSPGGTPAVESGDRALRA